MNGKLYSGGRWVGGVREVVGIVRMSELSPKEAHEYVRDHHGATISVEGPLATEIRGNPEFPFGMIATEKFGTTPVTQVSVVLVHPETRSPLEVVHEEFFDAHYKEWTPPDEQKKMEQEVETRVSVLNKLNSGEALTNEENALVVQYLREHGIPLIKDRRNG